LLDSRLAIGQSARVPRVHNVNALNVLVIGLGLWLLVFVLIRVVPTMRRGRFVVLDRPRPCSMEEAQHALDRLLAAGFAGEIVEDDDSGINMWANTSAAGEVKPSGRYVIKVPRKQADAASRV
jgi:hypothetical protein